MVGTAVCSIQQAAVFFIMSSMTDQFASDLEGVETDLPTTFYWRGKAYTGTRTQVADTFDLEDAGIVQQYDFELIVRVELFATLQPSKNDEIEIVDTLKPGKPRLKYRIEKITVSPDGIAYTLGCVEQG